LGTGPNAAFRKESNSSADFETRKRLADSPSIGAITSNRKSAQSMHQRRAQPGTEQFLHSHPIDITRTPGADQWRVEMADMIAG
jgi:hypothetical protein